MARKIWTGTSIWQHGKHLPAHRRGAFRQTDQFFNQDFNNFAPRVAVAWDVTGNSRTVFRAGYGVFYDATSASFVQRNSESARLCRRSSARRTHLPEPVRYLSDVLGGGAFTYNSSARALDKDIVTAYNQQWNATLEHDLLGKGVLVSLAYVGAKGDKLYS